MATLKIYADGTCFTYGKHTVTEKQLDQSLTNLAKSKSQRFFEINQKTKRLIRAASAAQFWGKAKKYKVLFVTLTMSDKLKLSHKDSNKALNLYIQNLKNNYKLNSYVGVHEYQENGASHYHFLLELPKVDFKAINNAWGNAIRTVTNSAYSSACGVRVGIYKNGKKISNVILSPDTAVKYITKYITKQKGELKTTKTYFISNNIRNTCIEIEGTDKQFNYALNMLIEKRSAPVYITDYVTYYQVSPILALQLIEQFSKTT